MIKTKTFYFNELRECTYILWDDTGEAVIVDPGCFSQSEKERLVKFVESEKLSPVMILQTHGHFDHIMGSAFVTEKWGLETYIHPADIKLMESAVSYTEMFGYKIEQPSSKLQMLSHGQELKFGNSSLFVMYTPGHTQGGVCFYTKETNNEFVVTGDTLFAGSIGRTDLPGGDYDQIMESLLGKLVKLGPKYRVLPGHGPETTIGTELDTNPFLRYE